MASQCSFGSLQAPKWHPNVTKCCLQGSENSLRKHLSKTLPKRGQKNAKPRTRGVPKDQHLDPFPPTTPPQGATPKKTEPLRSAFRHHLRAGWAPLALILPSRGGPGGRGTSKIDSKLTKKLKNPERFFSKIFTILGCETAQFYDHNLIT